MLTFIIRSVYILRKFNPYKLVKAVSCSIKCNIKIWTNLNAKSGDSFVWLKYNIQAWYCYSWIALPGGTPDL